MLSRNQALYLQHLSIYHFWEGRITQLNATKWVLSKCKHTKVIISNSDGTVQIHVKKEAVIINYASVTAYFAKIEEGFIALHFPKNAECLGPFDLKLRQSSIALIEWTDAKLNLKQELQRQCGEDINTQMNINHGMMFNVGYSIGSLFGSITKMVMGKKLEEQRQNKQKNEEIKMQKMETIQEQSAKDGKKQNGEVDKNADSKKNKGKWSNLKQNVKQMNQKLNKKIHPTTQKVSNATAQLGGKFYHSQNGIIRAIKGFGLNFKESLNQGYIAPLIKNNESKPKQQNKQSQKQIS